MSNTCGRVSACCQHSQTALQHGAGSMFEAPYYLAGAAVEKKFTVCQENADGRTPAVLASAPGGWWWEGRLLSGACSRSRVTCAKDPTCCKGHADGRRWCGERGAPMCAVALVGWHWCGRQGVG